MEMNGAPLEFSTQEEFSNWLTAHENEPTGVWLVVGRKGGSLPVIPYLDALVVALAHGWIDSLARKIDADSFAQRFTPRRAQSPWSARNRDRVSRMEADGSLSPRGLAEVERARRDGRWPVS